MAAAEFEIGRRVAGTPYLVLGRLGQGGMGCVYEVEHTELGKRFVLKALLLELAARADIVQRFCNEWRALGRLDHPNIVSVSDAGVSPGGVPYYVMERLRGETLSARIRRVGKFTLVEALGIAADMLDGLAAAHAIGVVHRDVKPANIFLAELPLSPARVLKLLDFGIAKLLDPQTTDVTAQGIALGTPRYMAPEQALGSNVDARADLYAVGLILFEMLAGKGPFEGASASELLTARLTRSPPRLSTQVLDVSPELDGLVSLLLSRDPDLRPATASVASAILRSMLRGLRLEPVSDTQSAALSGALTPLVGQPDKLDPQRREQPATVPDGVGESRSLPATRGDGLGDAGAVLSRAPKVTPNPSSTAPITVSQTASLTSHSPSAAAALDPTRTTTPTPPTPPPVTSGTSASPARGSMAPPHRPPWWWATALLVPSLGLAVWMVAQPSPPPTPSSAPADRTMADRAMASPERAPLPKSTAPADDVPPVAAGSSAPNSSAPNIARAAPPRGKLATKHRSPSGANRSLNEGTSPALPVGTGIPTPPTRVLPGSGLPSP